MAAYDTIVVGMGVAGTAASSVLARAGRSVLALEAMPRVGGRIQTVPFGDGVVELGAEWIHGTVNSSPYELARQYNVPLIAQDISMRVFMSDGSLADGDLLNELLEFALNVVDDPPAEPEPLGQFVTRRLMSYIEEKHPTVLNDKGFIKELLAFLDLMTDNYEATDSWNDVTTHSKYKILDGHQNMSWHRHGYKTLFEILLNTYNNGVGLPNLTIKLNTEVTQIIWPKDSTEKVVVKTKDGAQYTADSVIVTVSVGVLKERHSALFSPPLPETKLTSINHLTMGLLGKIVLLFPYQWWPKGNTFFGFMWRAEDKVEVTEEVWSVRLQASSNPAGCRNAMTVWTSGEVGRLVETLPEEVVKRKAMELLRRFMGAGVDIPEPINMARTSWWSNPYTRGSYTYDNLESPNHPTARSDLAEPLRDVAGKPRVLFAGEATELTHFSTVHGALDSGRREAQRLLPGSKI